MGTQRQMQSRMFSAFGFSLIEVNMAVFVMAVGIIAMAALYPLGLRESIQSTADLKQSMFADLVLGAAVAAASNSNLTWTAFQNEVALANGSTAVGQTAKTKPPVDVQRAVDRAVAVFNADSDVKMVKDLNYQLYCFRVPRRSGDIDSPIMGFLVYSIDMDTRSMASDDLKRLLGNQQVYYAEALFQGVQ